MLHDHYGCSLSTKKPEVVQAIDLFSSELLRLGKRINSILEGVKKYPEEPILQIYAAIFYLFMQTEQSQRKAIEHLDNASILIDQGNEREKSLFSAAWCWSTLQMTEALKRFECHCYKWPKDLTALKIAEFIFYCKGQKYEAHRFLRLTSYSLQEHQELKTNPFFLAIHSFALELAEKYEDSLHTAELSLKLDETNPWVHHALSHYYLNRGLVDEGIEFLEQYAPLWNQFNPVIESHNFWHLALLYLENLEFEKIRELYERVGWTNQPKLVSEQIDAASLLWRLDLEEMDILANHWQALAESIDGHANFVAVPFISAQLCYALKRGNRDEALKEALAKIKSFALEQMKEDRFVWKEIGLPLIKGCLAAADHDYTLALKHFDPIIDKVSSVGGSDAQIDLFYETYLKCLMGSQRYADSERLVHQMTQGRNMTKLELKWLAECSQSLPATNP